MTLTRKFLIFAAANALIALAAAYAPMSLIAGIAFQRHAVVFDFIDNAEPGSKLNVILGDSRPECCIAAEDLGFVNLSLAGSTPVEGYHQLKRLIDRGVDVERLVLSYGPFHIFSQDTYYSRTRYYKLVDPEFTAQVDREIVELGDEEYQDYQWSAMQTIESALPFLSDDFKFKVVNIVSINRTIAWAFVGLFDAIMPGSNDERELADPDRKISEATSIAWVNVGGAPPEYDDPEAQSPLNELYLRRLIQLARENGVDLHYLVMPMNKDVDQPDAAYFQRFNQLISSVGLSHCYSGIKWWPNELFWDPSHLNWTGVERLDKQLPQLLEYCQA